MLMQPEPPAEHGSDVEVRDLDARAEPNVRPNTTTAVVMRITPTLNGRTRIRLVIVDPPSSVAEGPHLSADREVSDFTSSLRWAAFMRLTAEAGPVPRGRRTQKEYGRMIRLAWRSAVSIPPRRG